MASSRTARDLGRFAYVSLEDPKAHERNRLRAELTESFSQTPGRLHLVRAHCWPRADRHLVRPVGAQGAGMVHALAAANAWMVVPAEVDHLPAGALVEVWPMS